ncbi:MAG: hypothetical protein KFF68_06820 [Desulfosarcina sp.]|nr:hypothetical protein [Desulfosarcina sp.]
MASKPLSWIIALSMVWAPFGCLADQSQSPQGPSAFLPVSIYEFAPVVEGTQVVHEFILQNRGDAPLEIIKIDSG